MFFFYNEKTSEDKFSLFDTFCLILKIKQICPLDLGNIFIIQYFFINFCYLAIVAADLIQCSLAMRAVYHVDC